MTTKKKATQKSFTAIFNELESLTASFEKGDFNLDEGLEKFERGLELAKRLKERLQQVEQRVEKLKTRFDALSLEENKNHESGTD